VVPISTSFGTQSGTKRGVGGAAAALKGGVGGYEGGGTAAVALLLRGQVTKVVSTSVLMVDGCLSYAKR
jgi:hypothetical protein